MEKKEKKGLIQEFKEFISRGNVLDMAVGVVIGNAFGAIVTALVNILLSLCLWAVPGGLKGLVTVLPALNDAQKGMNETISYGSSTLGQKFAASDLQGLAENLAQETYGILATPQVVEQVKGTILSKYTLHGTTYTYNMSSVIDWGAIINAFISFIIIAIVLFAIVKIANKSAQIRLEAKERLKKKVQEQEELNN